MVGGSKENEAKRGGETSRAEVREAGRFAYQGLERVIHEKARLSILSSLAVHGEGLLFNDLKALCTLTDGNLSRQLQFLQEEGLVEVWKGFKNRRPQTLCRLTPEGRKRFLEYVTTLEKVVSDAADVARQSRNVRLPAPEGFSPA
jgi:DNA-binding HxlR family transcriptional regulator